MNESMKEYYEAGSKRLEINHETDELGFGWDLVGVSITVEMGEYHYDLPEGQVFLIFMRGDEEKSCFIEKVDEVEKLKGLLEKYSTGSNSRSNYCSCCHNYDYEGCKPDCEIAEALK